MSTQVYYEAKSERSKHPVSKFVIEFVFRFVSDFKIRISTFIFVNRETFEHSDPTSYRRPEFSSWSDTFSWRGKL
jgi:hypothetical protein